MSRDQYEPIASGFEDRADASASHLMAPICFALAGLCVFVSCVFQLVLSLF